LIQSQKRLREAREKSTTKTSKMRVMGKEADRPKATTEEVESLGIREKKEALESIEMKDPTTRRLTKEAMRTIDMKKTPIKVVAEAIIEVAEVGEEEEVDTVVAEEAEEVTTRRTLPTK
jgi:hypothetical protein